MWPNTRKREAERSIEREIEKLKMQIANIDRCKEVKNPEV
jgi:hypothetical protein